MERCKGHRLFERFLKRNKIEQLQAAKALGASPASVNSWIKGVRQPDGTVLFWTPRPAMQDNIAAWTKGAVPVESWRTRAEQRSAASVEPFQPARAAAAAGAISLGDGD